MFTEQNLQFRMNMENERKTQKAKFQWTPVEKQNFYWEYQRILMEDD
jgi:hypothetical protein